MGLTAKEIYKLAAERIQGIPQSIKGPEADAFLESLDADIALAKKKGWTIELPHEIPGGGDD